MSIRKRADTQWTVSESAFTDNRKVITGLDESTSYDFRVRRGVGPYSAIVSDSTTAQPPVVTVTQAMGTSISISWTPGSILTGNYEVGYKFSSSNVWTTETTTETGTTYTIDDLSAGTYDIRVRRASGPYGMAQATLAFIHATFTLPDNADVGGVGVSQAEVPVSVTAGNSGATSWTITYQETSPSMGTAQTATVLASSPSVTLMLDWSKTYSISLSSTAGDVGAAQTVTTPSTPATYVQYIRFGARRFGGVGVDATGRINMELARVGSRYSFNNYQVE